MTNVLKTGVNNYFINEDGSISMQYDPCFNSCFMMYNGDDPKIKISMDNINIQPGGQIVFKYDNKKFIIDDGYRNRLIMAGYLDLHPQNADVITIDDNIRLKELMINSFSNIKSIEQTDYDNNRIAFRDYIQGYEFNIIIETISKMIDRNIKRQELNLPMYPTERGHIKNTSVYFRIYCKRTSEAKSNKSYTELHNISDKLLVNSILLNKDLDMDKISEVNKAMTAFLVNEMKIRKTILKREEDL